MSTRTAGWLAWSVCTVSLLILASSLLLIVLGWSPLLVRGVDTVARLGRLLGEDHRCTHPRRPHRLTPP